MKRASVWTCMLSAAIIAHSATVAGPAAAADAPFGFAWSARPDSLPRPSSLVADANILVLIYEGATVPPAMKDTQIVTLSVCGRLGLQQVRWVSRILSLSTGIKKFVDIYEAGVARYGEADHADLDKGTAAWSTQHIGMRLVRAGEDGFHIVMISDGPQFEQCQNEQRRLIGPR
jgi:hypothetical protein